MPGISFSRPRMEDSWKFTLSMRGSGPVSRENINLGNE